MSQQSDFGIQFLAYYLESWIDKHKVSVASIHVLYSVDLKHMYITKADNWNSRLRATWLESSAIYRPVNSFQMWHPICLDTRSLGILETNLPLFVKDHITNEEGWGLWSGIIIGGCSNLHIICNGTVMTKLCRLDAKTMSYFMMKELVTPLFLFFSKHNAN